MTTVRMRIEISGDVQLDRTLLRVTDRARDMRPVFRALEEDFYLIEREQFDSEGQRGSGWKQLAASTVLEKQRQHLDPRILHATLKLRHSLTGPKEEGSVRAITKTAMFVGTDVRSKKGFPYANVHQNPKRSKLARRRPVEFTRRDRVRWPKAIQRYLMTGQVDVSGF